jgi:cytochrome P450
LLPEHKADNEAARLNATISDEVDAAMRQYLPSCDDWTEVDINRKLVDIVARVSGRVFVGPELAQDSEYLDIAANYTIYLMDAVHATKRLRPWQKPFLASRLPEMKKLRAVEKLAAEQLDPIVKERLEAEKNDPNWQKPDDMMQWLLNHNSAGISAEQIAKTQLGLIFAAIHTTTMTATNILYTLAVTPDCTEPLREEVRNTMHENDGQLTSKALQQMLKLESYMKECIRVHSLGVGESTTPSVYSTY